MENYFNF